MPSHNLDDEVDAMFERAEAAQAIAPQSAMDQALEFGGNVLDQAVSFGQSAVEGRTGGLYAPVQRYVGGAAEYAVQNIMGNPISFGEAVDRIGVERSRQREENPAATLAGEVTGALGLGIATAPAMMAPSMLGRGFAPAAKRIGAGALYGGAENAALNLFQGESETPVDVMRDIGIGGAFGGLGQAGMEVAGPAYREMAKRGVFGKKAVATQADELLAQNLFEEVRPGGPGLRSQAEMGQEDILSRAMTQGSDDIVGDIAPGVTTKLTSMPSTAGTTGPILQRSQNIVDNEFSGAEDLLLKHFNPYTNRTITKDVYKSIKSDFGDEYKRVIDRSLAGKQRFSVEEVLGTLRDATPGSIPEGAVSVFDGLEKYVKGPRILNDGILDVRGLLNLKKSIDKRIKTEVIEATDIETKNLLLEAKKNVNKLLDQVEGYTNVARKFSDNASEMAANNLGREIFKSKLSPDEISALMKDMSADEIFSLRQGTLVELREAAARSGEPNFIKKNFSDRDTPIRRNLEAVFGEAKIDKMLKEANKFTDDVINAKNRIAAIEGKASPVGTDPSNFDQAASMGVLGSSILSGHPLSVTAAAGAGKVLKPRTQADALSQQTQMGMFQQPPTPENLGSLMELKALEKRLRGGGSLAPGLAAGVGGSNLLDMVKGPR